MQITQKQICTENLDTQLRKVAEAEVEFYKRMLPLENEALDRLIAAYVQERLCPQLKLDSLFTRDELIQTAVNIHKYEQELEEWQKLGEYQYDTEDMPFAVPF